jgi:hypothetical protein
LQIVKLIEEVLHKSLVILERLEEKHLKILNSLDNLELNHNKANHLTRLESLEILITSVNNLHQHLYKLSKLNKNKVQVNHYLFNLYRN